MHKGPGIFIATRMGTTSNRQLTTSQQTENHKELSGISAYHKYGTRRTIQPPRNAIFDQTPNTTHLQHPTFVTQPTNASRSLHTQVHHTARWQSHSFHAIEKCDSKRTTQYNILQVSAVLLDYWPTPPTTLTFRKIWTSYLTLMLPTTRSPH
jgi:hypothetical protein